MSELVFPNKCIFCGKIIADKKLMCDNCSRSVLPIGETVCENCGRDIEYCSCKIGDFAFARNISYFYYAGTVKMLVYRFKFRKKPQLGSIISGYMVSAIRDKYKNFTFDFVTFVPSSKLKQIFRGYNPAKILAENISKELGLPLKRTLESKFRIKSQKSMNKQKRRNSVKGKFYLKASDIEGKHILLIDDVMTTGSTMSECARVLKKAGAREISCATFAITLKK